MRHSGGLSARIRVIVSLGCLGACLWCFLCCPTHHKQTLVPLEQAGAAGGLPHTPLPPLILSASFSSPFPSHFPSVFLSFSSISSPFPLHSSCFILILSSPLFRLPFSPFLLFFLLFLLRHSWKRRIREEGRKGTTKRGTDKGEKKCEAMEK